MSLSGNSAGPMQKKFTSRNKQHSVTRRPISPNVLKKRPCHQCGTYGHWKDSHNSDGSLRPDSQSFNTPEEFSSKGSTNYNSGNGNSARRKTVQFNMAVLSGFSTEFNSTFNYDKKPIGPLVDDGAPYSAIGEVELSFLLEQIGHGQNLNKIVDKIPGTLNGFTVENQLSSDVVTTL